MLRGKFLRIDGQDEKLLIIKTDNNETFAVPLSKALEDVLLAEIKSRDQNNADNKPTLARQLNKTRAVSDENCDEESSAHERITESRISEDISGGQGLTPREIQQRVRSGLTEEEISDKFEVPIEKVRRYSLQVKREKILIIDQFMHLSARSSKRGRTLVDVVNEYFDFHGIDRLDVHWNATKNEHEPWIIQVEFELEDDKTIAIWTWDPKSSIISESNEVSRKITKYYEDAAFDDEPVFLGAEKKSKAISQSSEKYHTVSFSTGLRLKELRKSLDADFKTQTAKQIIDTSYQNINTDRSVNYFTEHEEFEKSEDFEQVKNDDSDAKLSSNRPVLSILKLASEKDITAHPVVDENNEFNAPDLREFVTKLDKKHEDDELQNDDNTVNINITGRMREKFQKKRKTRTKVPSWDEVMFPKSNEDQDDDFPTAA
ncbi:MAG: DUF3071 domain-containing protein [Candidatus Ancillula sp.]|jgi:hypothetical protein|nr:DUF3071 domain-containing protein [Candidatus Ancillula sp.]